MSQPEPTQIERKTYHWNDGNRTFTIITSIKGKKYQLDLSVFNNHDPASRTIHTPNYYYSIHDQLDEVIWGLFDHYTDKRKFCEIFYDLYAVLNNPFMIPKDHHLFDRFYTANTYDGKDTLSPDDFRQTNEYWLLYNTDMSMRLVKYGLNPQCAMAYLYEFNMGKAEDTLDNLKALCVIHAEISGVQQELFSWAYERVSKLYIETFGKKVQECLSMHPNLIKLIFDHLA